MRTFHEYSRIAIDDTFRETLQHGDADYPFAYYVEDIWQFDFHCIDWHWHHEFEFLFMEEGSARCYIGSDEIELPQGCGLFVNSGILHRYETTGRTLTPNIVFSPALLAPEQSLLYQKYIYPVIHSAVAWQIFDPKTAWQNEVLECLISVFHLQEEAWQNELETVSLLLRLWDLFFRHLPQQKQPGGSEPKQSRQARLQIMMQYIHSHYREPITLEQIASSVSISKSGALQLFQSGIRTSPVSYLIQYRLSRAAKLLHTTKKPVSEIASETGFSSAEYFCRKFKEHYHMTPNTYRRKFL